MRYFGVFMGHPLLKWLLFMQVRAKDDKLEGHDHDFLNVI